MQPRYSQVHGRRKTPFLISLESSALKKFGKWCVRVLLGSRFGTLCIYILMHLYLATVRLTIENEDRWKKLLEEGQSVVICCWHQHFFSVMRRFGSYRNLNPGLMISRSRDGSFIAGVAGWNGWHVAHGSSSRGGGKALADLIAHVQKSRFGAHLLDGPRGPAGIVKAGVIRLAHETNAVVVPFTVTPERAWHFKSWDRFFVPKPFSRITLHFLEPMRFEEGKERFEEHRLQLQRLLRAKTGMAELSEEEEARTR